MSEDFEDSDTDIEEESTDEEDEEESDEDKDNDEQDDAVDDSEAIDDAETDAEEASGEEDEPARDQTGAGHPDMEDGPSLDPAPPSGGDGSGIRIPSKRKSSHVDDVEGQVKRRRANDVRDVPPRAPDRSSSAKPRASEQQEVIAPPEEEHTPAVPPFEAPSKSDSPAMKLKELLDRWYKLNELARKAGKASGKWMVDFIHWRTAARRILESEGRAIVPEIMDDSDATKVLDDVGKKVADAEKEMDIRVKRRKSLRKDKLRSIQEIGFGGPLGTNPIEGEFVLQRILGEGSWGIASLWVRHDAAGNIVGRVAIKDEFVKETRWNIPITFFGDVQNRQPREAIMHRLISNQDPDAIHIVKFLANALFLEEKLLRTYMEYCELGDFWETWEKMIETRKKGDQFLSTPALWAMFESLAKAAHLMTFGCFPNRQQPAGWESMIHRDIKADNGKCRFE